MKTMLFGLFVLVIAVLSYKTVQSTILRNPYQGEWHGKIVYAPPYDRSPIEQVLNTNVLGDSAGKRIEVNLGAQHVLAFEGGTKVNELVVSTGLWGRTPTGSFTIQRRVSSQTMAGGNRAIGTYYYLPGVPWVQFFGNAQIPWSRGYSFHGTYWHNNFGHPMSHGCINMKTPDAKWLWDWAPMGTPVNIY
jgi:lipoprotein-anchoring transpeptidase ErfK/SrfK